MQTLWKSKKKKLHTRKIEISTYEYDEQRILVEGFLKDDGCANRKLIIERGLC